MVDLNPKILLDAEDLIDAVDEIVAEIEIRGPLPRHLIERIERIGYGVDDIAVLDGFKLGPGPDLLSILAVVRAQPA